jgi:hypothetical protein
MPTTGHLARRARHVSRNRASSSASKAPDLYRRHHARHGDLVVDADRLRIDRRRRPASVRADQVLDHAGEAELHAVARVVDALDAVGLQLGDLLRRDRAAAAHRRRGCARHRSRAGMSTM